MAVTITFSVYQLYAHRCSYGKCSPAYIQHLTVNRLDQIDPRIVQYVTLSLERSWCVVGPEKSSAWTVIYAYATDKIHDTQLIEQLAWNLRSWPLELVMWGTQNSHRLDIRKNPEQDR